MVRPLQSPPLSHRKQRSSDIEYSVHMTRRPRTIPLTPARRRRRYALRRVVLLATIALTAGLLVLADRAGVFGRTPRPDAETYDGGTFRVTHVVDGDTLDVDAPDRVNGQTTTRIRLWGVDTPETVKPNTPKQHFGPEATRFTRDFCMGMGKTVRLELVKDRDTRDKYGRLLAYVWASAAAGEKAVCLNAELIGRGYGYSDPRFAHPRKLDFRDLQRRARENGVGLWADARDEDLPHYYRGKIKLGR